MTVQARQALLQPLRSAIEAGDHAAAVEALSPEVVFYSPLIGVRFQGRDAVGRLLGGVIENFADLRYVDELEGAESHSLHFRARVGKGEIEGVDLLGFDSAGKVSEFRVLIRPLSGLLAVAKALTPYIAKGRGRATLMRLLIGPLAALVALGDRIVPRLIRLGS